IWVVRRNGRAELTRGDDVWGRSRACTAAAADGLIGSLWKVNGAAAAVFMRLLYQSLDTGSGPGALRAAMPALRRMPLDEFRAALMDIDAALDDGRRRLDDASWTPDPGAGCGPPY